GVYRSRATRNIWMLDELGVDFELVPVIQSFRLSDPHAADAPTNTRTPSFVAVNSNARIPAIEDDGLVLNESLAINLYLARKHGGPLSAQSLSEDGQMLSWTAWTLTELEPIAIQIFYHRVMKPEGERDANVAAQAIADLQQPFAVLNAALATSDYIVGDRFTVVDINVAECARYAQAAPELFEAHPNVDAWIKRCQARPAFVEMMKKREAEPA
ncbi:MAG: glutathione S-transferase family protein, partial [Pseudomonadota bacterium]